MPRQRSGRQAGTLSAEFTSGESRLIEGPAAMAARGGDRKADFHHHEVAKRGRYDSQRAGALLDDGGGSRRSSTTSSTAVSPCCPRPGRIPRRFGELYIMGEYCNDMMGKYQPLLRLLRRPGRKQEDWTEEDWEDELHHPGPRVHPPHRGPRRESGAWSARTSSSWRIPRRARAGIAARRRTKQGPADGHASAGPCPSIPLIVLGHREELQRLSRR